MNSCQKCVTWSEPSTLFRPLVWLQFCSSTFFIAAPSSGQRSECVTAVHDKATHRYHTGTLSLGPLQTHSEIFLGQSPGGVAVEERKYRKKKSNLKKMGQPERRLGIRKNIVQRFSKVYRSRFGFFSLRAFWKELVWDVC